MQKKFYAYLEKIVKPVYYSLIKGTSQWSDFNEVLNDCVEDVYLFVMQHNDIVYTNFESFIRKRFEYFVLSKRASIRAASIRNNAYHEEILEEPIEEKPKHDKFVEESIDSIVEFMSANKDKFTLNDQIIIMFYSKGYNLNEISKLLGFSYGKTKSSFDSVIFKLKNYFYGQNKK